MRKITQFLIGTCVKNYALNKWKLDGTLNMLCNMSTSEQDSEEEEITSEFQQSLPIISGSLYLHVCVMSSCRSLEIFQSLSQVLWLQWRSETLQDKTDDPISSLGESPKTVGAETTTLQKQCRHDQHCTLPVFPEKSRRLLQEYVNYAADRPQVWAR